MQRKCWASSLGGCSGKISKEHLISECISKNGIVYSNRGGQVRGVDGRNVKAKILCTVHNRALSPVDSEAGRFYEAVRTFMRLGNAPGDASHEVSGPFLERWFIKSTINMVIAEPPPGFARWPGGGRAVPKQLVEVAFGARTLSTAAGLYKVNVEDGYEIYIDGRVLFRAHLNDGEIVGATWQLYSLQYLIWLREDIEPPASLGAQIVHRDIGGEFRVDGRVGRLKMNWGPLPALRPNVKPQPPRAGSDRCWCSEAGDCAGVVTEQRTVARSVIGGVLSARSRARLCEAHAVKMKELDDEANRAFAGISGLRATLAGAPVCNAPDTGLREFSIHGPRFERWAVKTAIQAVISDGINLWYPSRPQDQPPVHLVNFVLGRGPLQHPAGLYDVSGGYGYDAAAPPDQLKWQLIQDENKEVSACQIYFAGVSFLLWLREERSFPWTDAFHRHRTSSFAWGPAANHVALEVVWRGEPPGH